MINQGNKEETLKDMVRILGNSRDGNLILNNLKYIINQNIEIGCSIFLCVP